MIGRREPRKAGRPALLWSMLLAARDRIVEGVEAFREILDPFGDGPSAVEEFAGGFEVRPTLNREGKPPAVVRVGG